MSISSAARLATRVAFAAVLTAALAGCGSGTPVSTTTSSQSLNGNWQFQQAPTGTGTILPATGVLLRGALTGSGSQVSGTFRYSNLAQPHACGLDQVVTVSGTFDSGRTLTLTSAALPGGGTLKLNLLLPATLTAGGFGTLEVSGGAAACVVASGAALGVQIAPLNGTFTGSVTQSTATGTTTGGSGTATVQFTQGRMPDASGQFPLSGVVQIVVPGCTVGGAVTGTVSGVGVMTGSSLTPLPTVILGANGATVPAGTSVSLLLSAVPLPGSTAACPPAGGLLVSGTLGK